MMVRKAIALALVVVVLASACSTRSEFADTSTGEPTVGIVAPTEVPEPTTPPPATTEPAPTPAPTATPPDPTALPLPTPTPTPVPTPQPPGPCDVGPLALPNSERPIYDGLMVIDPAAGTIEGWVTVTFTPDLDTDEIYVRLWPNGPRPSTGGAMMTLGEVAIADAPIEPEMIEPTIARLPLAQTLKAGESLEATINYELAVPNELNSRVSGREDYLRLGSILPILPWEPGRGWALDPATSLFAESVSSPVADYSIKVEVPEGYTVLASGVVDDSETWRVEAARDFAVSVGRFRTVTATAMAPEPVQVIVGIHETIDDNADVYLAKIVDSLEQFSGRWGQYPWPSLTFAVTPNLSGGIEFPTHIMQGPNTTGRVTSHEVGHMFFYSLVGNNQGSEPWLDEGITSYAEFTYEGTPPNAFAIPGGGVGNATQPMTFWEGRSDLYYRSVYAQVGFALQQLGEREDVDCALARYVADNAHQIATSDDFVAAFEPTFPNVIEQLAALGVVIAAE